MNIEHDATEQVRRLRAQAQKAVMVGASVTTAISHADLALISAGHGGLPIGVTDDINKAKRLLLSAVSQAEGHRLRKLRKAERKEKDLD